MKIFQSYKDFKEYVNQDEFKEYAYIFQDDFLNTFFLSFKNRYIVMNNHISKFAFIDKKTFDLCNQVSENLLNIKNTTYSQIRLVLKDSYIVFFKLNIDFQKDKSKEFAGLQIAIEKDLYIKCESYKSKNITFDFYNQKYHFYIKNEDKSLHYSFVHNESKLFKSFPIKSPYSFLKSIYFDRLFIDFFKHYLHAKYPKWYLLNDLDTKEYHLIRNNLENLQKFHTKQALIEYMVKSKIPFNVNKLSFYAGLVFSKALEFICEKDYHKLYTFTLEYSFESKYTYNFLIKEKENYILNTLPEYLICFYSQKYKDKCNKQIVYDYIKMSCLEKQPIKLHISFNRLKSEHDKLSKEISLKKHNSIPLTINSKFTDLNLSKDFKILQTELDLAIEGYLQKHCVASYIQQVNKGICVIVSTIYQNKRYTLEIKRIRNAFVLNQIKGFANSDPPQELIELVNKELKENNALLSNKAKEIRNLKSKDKRNLEAKNSEKRAKNKLKVKKRAI